MPGRSRTSLPASSRLPRTVLRESSASGSATAIDSVGIARARRRLQRAADPAADRAGVDEAQHRRQRPGGAAFDRQQRMGGHVGDARLHAGERHAGDAAATLFSCIEARSNTISPEASVATGQGGGSRLPAAGGT